MTRKTKIIFSTEQKLEYAKLMIDEGYSNQQIMDISGASKSAVSSWRSQYKKEIQGITPAGIAALTPEQQRIQELEKQLKRAQRDNEILKKATAFFVRDNQNLN